ncbi:MAG: VOC family protein [Anaerolineae bacterium]
MPGPSWLRRYRRQATANPSRPADGLPTTPARTMDYCLGSAGTYLCRGTQGHTGAWVWIGVGDVRAVYQLYLERGAIIRQSPQNEPYALEMQIEDFDGNVLRFGSDPEGYATSG